MKSPAVCVSSLLVLFLGIHGSAAAQEYEFSDVTDSAGVSDSAHDHFGSSWADYDQDGFLDLYVVNVNENTLYRNEGDGSFTDVTLATGTGDPWEAMRNVFADYDRDGDLDFYSHNFVQSTLYQNNDNVFTDVNTSSGAGIQMNKGTGAAWADYDGDGWLDLHATGFPGFNVLLHSNGDGTFSDVRAAAGMPFDASVMGNAWADFDNDGDQDIALATVTRDDQVYFYENNGDGTFSDVSTSTGILPITEAGSSGAGVTFGDYDNDGHLDLVLTEVNLGSEKTDPLRIYLFHNNGDKTFTDQTDAAGVFPPTGAGYWDAAWVDYNNDGHQDLFVSTDRDSNHLFENNGDGSFSDVAPSLGIGESAVRTVGGIWGDYNNDGDMDLYACNQDHVAGQIANTLFENSGGSRHWLQVELKGSVSNLDAIGARVILHPGDGTMQMREVNGGTGFFSQHTHIQHFGLDERTTVGELVIEWPSGSVQRFEDVAADQRLSFEEPPVVFVVNEEVVGDGDNLVFSSEHGPAGNPLMLALVEVNSSPFFLKLLVSSYSPQGEFELPFVVGDLSGFEARFQMFALSQDNTVLASNRRSVSFQ